MHKWFDTLKEPKRFLVFFIPVSVLLVGINVGNYTINYISWGILLVLLVTRIIHIYKG